MPDTRIEQPLASRALHGWSILTVVATVALLGIGSIVTTFRVGMTDPVWPTYPWHLLLISYDEPNTGFLIEHTHRLAGYIVGCCVIVLAVWLQLSARRRWLKWLGWGALLAVCLQGLLGGLRVKYNALKGPELAAVHGVFAQVVFSLIVSVAVFTAPGFPRGLSLDPGQSRALRRLSWTLATCVFLQVVWGVLTRHFYHPLAQRLHFLTAFAVVAVLVWFMKTVWDLPAAWQRLRTPTLLFAVLVVIQLMLGVEAWLARFGSGVLPDAQRATPEQAVIRTAHVLLGSWLLAISVSCILLVRGVKVPATELALERFHSEPRPRSEALQTEARPTSVHPLETAT